MTAIIKNKNLMKEERFSNITTLVIVSFLVKYPKYYNLRLYTPYTSLSIVHMYLLLRLKK